MHVQYVKYYTLYLYIYFSTCFDECSPSSGRRWHKVIYTHKLKRKLHTLHKKEVLADIDVTIEILCCLHIHG